MSGNKKMQREIKFRAWDKGHNKMSYKVNLYSLNSRGEIDKCQIDNKQIMNRVGLDCEIMQFTGLSDKYGKYIYEGDIVSHNHRLHEVVINFNGYYLQRYKLWNGEFKPAFQYSMSLITKPSKDRFGGKVDSAEVVGNIYENPELLKKLNDSTTLNPKQDG
jgi:uncharacterized phage protein (TIGR01671 family)